MDTKKSALGKIVLELMASQILSAKKIKGTLDHFNSFGKHDVWSIDEGESKHCYGVQLVIVLDGDIPSSLHQEIMQPKITVENVKTTSRNQKLNARSG